MEMVVSMINSGSESSRNYREISERNENEASAVTTTADFIAFLTQAYLFSLASSQVPHQERCTHGFFLVVVSESTAVLTCYQITARYALSPKS